jgi:hypothetical protein
MRLRSRKLSAAKQPTDERTVRISASVNIRAAAQPAEEGKPPGPPTFDAAPAYSGGLLPGYTAELDLPVVVDLAGMTEARAMKANLDHKKDQRVGHVTSVVNDQKTLAISGVLSAATPHRDQIVASSQDKYPWEVSIEAALRGLERVPKGRTVTVNGQTFTGPIYVSRRSVLTGIGFADAGADAGNSVTIAAAAATKGKEMDFEKWLEQSGFDPATLTETQRATLKASYDASRERPNSEPEGDDVLGLTPRRLEVRRLEEIRLVAHRAFDDSPHDGERIEALARQAVEEHWTAQELELRILRAGRQPSRARFSTHDSQVDGRVLEAALLQAAAYPKLEEEYDEQTLDAIDRNGFRHMGIQQVLLMAACHNGYPGRPGERILPGNLPTILDYAFPPATAQLRATGFSTISLPGILGNVANKEISVGFTEEDQEWREISVIKPVNNFYKRTCFSLLDDLEFQDLTPAGEIKHGKLSQQSYERQAKTRAIMLSLTREDIINDDAGALDDIRTRIGRGSGRKLNTIFWTAWLDDDAFFTTARGNFIEHANSTLLIDGVGLAMAKAAFEALRTPAADGRKTVSGPPVILLCPPELSIVAERFFISTQLVGGSSTVPSENVFARKYKPVAPKQLSDSNFSGYSALAWYLLRSPQIAPGMVVSALGGRVEPTVESAAASFNRMGIDFRGYSDVGADKAEFLCGVKMKGAAP